MAEERGRSGNAGADTLPQLGATEKMDLDPPAAVRYASLLAEVQASGLCRLPACPVKCKHWRLGACDLWIAVRCRAFACGEWRTYRHAVEFGPLLCRLLHSLVNNCTVFAANLQGQGSKGSALTSACACVSCRHKKALAARKSKGFKVKNATKVRSVLNEEFHKRRPKGTRRGAFKRLVLGTEGAEQKGREP